MSDEKIRGLFHVSEHEQGSANLWFFCPGCKETHAPTIGPGLGPRWTFNGDYEKPVFSPSLLVRWKEGEEGEVKKVCHSFIGCNGAQPGQISFLGDCTHALAGKVVDIPPFKWSEES